MFTLKVLDKTMTEIEGCTDKRSALETELKPSKLILDFVTNTSSCGCPMPCEQISYKVDTIYCDENNKMLLEGIFFSLFIAYSTLVVEERIETLNQKS